MNTHWSNDIQMGPRVKHSGDRFAGRTDLEQTRKYRVEDNGHHNNDRYGMVFDVSDPHSHRQSFRSRSPGRDDRARGHKQHRSRSPREHYGDKFRERDRDNRDKQRHKNRDRSDYDRRR